MLEETSAYALELDTPNPMAIDTLSFEPVAKLFP